MKDKETLELYLDAPISTIVEDFLSEHVSNVQNGFEVWAEKVYE